MKKIILILSLLCLSVVRASAQTTILPPILGDMNDDGKLTVVDITLLVNVNKGITPTLYTNLEEFSYIVNNEKVIGTWIKEQDGTSITFNADGTTDIHNTATYEFYPNKNRILVYDALGYIVDAMFLTEITDQYMDVIDYSTNVTTRYVRASYYVPVSSISVTPVTLELSPGESAQLTATVTPSNAYNANVIWTSSDENVAMVDANGLVTAVSGGTCTITCSTTDGSISATCEVTIAQLVTSITLSHTTLTLPVDGFQRITATVLPDNAVNKTVTWSSSDEDVAEVTRTGGVSGVGEGTCVITCAATDGSGVTATCQVTVGQSIMVTGITLSPSSITLNDGDTHQLTATVTPSNATNRNVAWNSSNVSVATVDANGLVTAVAVGTCTITCSAMDGSGVSATCAVTVVGENPSVVHEYVDLGLPSGTLWATTNVGANNPEDYGDYFAWGETEPKSAYNWSTYKYCNGWQNNLTKYCTQSSYGYNGFTDNLTELEMEDDAANVNWGAEWVMPTKEQLNELKENCTWTISKLNSVKGYRVTGTNGNSIFLPLAGSISSNSSNVAAGSISYYWSSTLYTDGPAYPCDASYLYLISNPSSGPNVTIKPSNRCSGFSVRPVRRIMVSSISLPSTAEVSVGSTITLTATVLPDNASYKNVTWSSSDESVATVDADGLITGVADGTCVITATAADGSSVSATCLVTVLAHSYVDLGLPSGTLWATCNVGASSPGEYGNFYAWGETTGRTEGKTTFYWSTYKYCNGDEYKLTRYCTKSTYGNNGFTDNLSELQPMDDAAYINWGANWRMPSKEQWEELMNYTTATETTQNGSHGIKCTSNGKSIFLPAAGAYHGNTYDNGSYEGGYWSRTLFRADVPCMVYVRYFGVNGYSMSSVWRDRCYGRSVRPVRNITQ